MVSGLPCLVEPSDGLRFAMPGGAAGFMPFGETPTPYFPASARNSRFGAGMALTLVLMVIIIIGTLGIFAIRVAIAQVR